MLFAEPETSRFLAAVQRLKQNKRKQQRRSRQALRRLRAARRKPGDG